MKRFYFEKANIVFLAISFAIAANAKNTCVAVNKNEASQLFEKWNKSLITGDPKKVVQNYAEDAVLIPTLSNQIRLTQDQRIDYFKHFLIKKPTAKLNSNKINVACNKIVSNGIYTFTFNDKSQVKARYTFTYINNGKKWLITSHHSSLMPEKE